MVSAGLSPSFWWFPGNLWFSDASLPSLPPSSPGIHPTPFSPSLSSLCPCLSLCSQTSPFYQDTSHIGLGSMLVISFELDHFCKDPISKIRSHSMVDQSFHLPFLKSPFNPTQEPTQLSFPAFKMTPNAGEGPPT